MKPLADRHKPWMRQDARNDAVHGRNGIRRDDCFSFLGSNKGFCRNGSLFSRKGEPLDIGGIFRILGDGNELRILNPIGTYGRNHDSLGSQFHSQSTAVMKQEGFCDRIAILNLASPMNAANLLPLCLYADSAVFPVLRRRSRLPRMETSQTLHAFVLPDGMPLRAQDISGWANALT